MTADKQHLWLHLYSGDLFENLKAQSMKSENVPYRREEFREKHSIIEFNSDFNMVDGETTQRHPSSAGRRRDRTPDWMVASKRLSRFS